MIPTALIERCCWVTEEEYRKQDRRKACIWTTEAMIGAQEMMERATNKRDLKIAEALFHMALCVEFLLKDPSTFEKRQVNPK